MHPAARTIDVLRLWVKPFFTVVESTLFSNPDHTQWGFGIAHGSSFTFVWTDVTGQPDGPWTIQLTSGLAVDVADLSGPLAWANEQNCQTTFGKFFCPIIKERQRLAVIHETTMRTASFDPLFVGQGPVTFASLGADLRGLVNLHINTAAEQSKRVLSSFGGSSVVTTEAGMVLLLMLVSG